MTAGPPVEPNSCVFRAESPTEKEHQPVESEIQVEARLTINRGLNCSGFISHVITLCAKILHIPKDGVWARVLDKGTQAIMVDVLEPKRSEQAECMMCLIT